jgi:hypothetical protein
MVALAFAELGFRVRISCRSYRMTTAENCDLRIVVWRICSGFGLAPSSRAVGHDLCPTTARPRSRGYPHAPLQSPDRGGVRPLDPAVHRVPREGAPSTMGAQEISAFLTWLAVRQHVSASTQNQALSALLFLHRVVLGMEVGAIGQVPRARVPTLGAGRAQPRRSRCGHETPDRQGLDHRRAPLWLWAQDRGMPRAAREGHRLRPTSDRRSPRQGTKGPSDDATGGGSGAVAGAFERGEAAV